MTKQIPEVMTHIIHSQEMFYPQQLKPITVETKACLQSYHLTHTSTMHKQQLELHANMKSEMIQIPQQTI